VSTIISLPTLPRASRGNRNRVQINSCLEVRQRPVPRGGLNLVARQADTT
jgi:hypothetical protein